MRNDVAISATGLGKRYQRGRARHDSLRDKIEDLLTTLFSRNAGGDANAASFWALRNASLEIRRGENVGIIGLNGAGKSTLLKILSRIITPTEGSAYVRGRLGALLEVGTGFHQELTGRENVYLYGSVLGMARQEIAAKFDAIVEFSEIADFIDTPVKRYSSGMYVRLAFAVAAHLDPDILLLDEVLAVGDLTFQRKCIEFSKQLQQRGATILFVSHNMFSIKAMCRRVIYLKRGEIAFDGPTEEGLTLFESDSRLSKAPWFQAEETPAPIEFDHIGLCAENGEQKTVFAHGEAMLIKLRYKTSRSIRLPDFRVGFDRTDGVHCCTYSSASDGIGFSEIDGQGTIELRVPPLKLVADQYVATIVVREGLDGRMLCGINGETFHISHSEFNKNAYGVFNERGDWHFVRAGSSIEVRSP
jgi:lipopolysaccharide transport system ATP-binding protein